MIHSCYKQMIQYLFYCQNPHNRFLRILNGFGSHCPIILHFNNLSNNTYFDNVQEWELR